MSGLSGVDALGRAPRRAVIIIMGSAARTPKAGRSRLGRSSLAERAMTDIRENCLQETARRALRPFRYLRIPPQDRERVHLVRERVKCGKPSCRCARGLRHGPYTFLRYQYWDGAAGRDRYAREYVPRSELPRVRRWIRRVRAETALGWGQAGLLRRILVAVEKGRKAG